MTIVQNNVTLPDLLAAYRRARSPDTIRDRILTMREVECLSLDEIAEEMDLSVEVVARELGRAISVATGFPVLPIRRTA